MHDRSGPDGAARRREATDLYATVLEVVKRYHGSARVTRVSYGAGMPVDRLKLLMDRLLALGLLEAEEIEGRPAYDITARGQEFLDTYWKLHGFVEGLDRIAREEAARRARSGVRSPGTRAAPLTAPSTAVRDR